MQQHFENNRVNCYFLRPLNFKERNCTLRTTYKQLTQEERYLIYSYKRAENSIYTIAKTLNRPPSTVYRELYRNKGLKGYRPKQAHILSTERRQASRKYIKMQPEVIDNIESLLRQEHSPEQISGYLSIANKDITISHTTIYTHVRSDKHKGGTLYKHLRFSRFKRRKRYGKASSIRGIIRDRVSIDNRPSVVDSKGRIGDWEQDTIIGKGHKQAILSMVERKSHYTILIKLQNKAAHEVVSSINRYCMAYRSLFKTITSDNGKEFAEHKQISKILETDYYFCHPYSSHERGLNEQVNGLVRQYFPKGTSFKSLTQKDMEYVMRKLNNRPRKSLAFKTPNEIINFNQNVALVI